MITTTITKTSPITILTNPKVMGTFQNNSKDILCLNSAQDLKLLSKNDIKNAIIEINKLGQGCEGKVYEIPNTDYVIKVPFYKESNIDFSKAIEFNISPTDRINHVVAIIDNCQIQNRIQGVNPKRCNKFSLQYRPTSNDKDIAFVIDNISEKNIKDFYLQLKNAKDLGMTFDIGGDNSLLNLKTGKLTALDFTPSDIKNYPNTRTNFLTSFMDQCGSPYLLTKDKQNNLLRKSLLCLCELMKENKINTKTVCFDINNYFFPDMHDLQYKNNIKALCEKFNNNPYISTIEEIQKQL